MRFFSLLLIVIFSQISCKNDANKNIGNAELAELEETYSKDPNEENFNKLIQKFGAIIIIEQDKTQKELLINKAIDLCESLQKINLTQTFALELIKVNPENKKSKVYLLQIVEDMKSKGKTDVVNVLKKGFAQLYPNDAASKMFKDSLPASFDNMSAYMQALASKVFDDPGEKGVNVANTQNYIDVCESYALVFPYDTLSPDYLFKAAEMARALGTFPKTMGLYDWIISFFGNDKNAPMALFMKGFTFDNDLKQTERAKETYEAFLKKYPDHPMGKDIRFLLINLGKSDKEIMEQIEKNKTDKK